MASVLLKPSRILLRPLCRSCQIRTARTFYHSYDHPSHPPYPSTEYAILSAALSHVPSHGFTNPALQLGAKDAGYLSVSTNLFPRGVFELVMFYLVSKRLQLKERVEGTEGREGLKRFWEESKMGVGGRVRGLVLERLRMNVESGIVPRWQEALAIMAQPTYVPPSLRELSALSDEIWFLAGDTSADTSWYTKRASLAAIYSATEVYQTQDTSEGFRDTERFLDSRLEDLRKVGSSASAVGEWLGYTGMSVVNILRSKGFRW